MRFTSAFASFIAASAVVASPTGAPAIVERQICHSNCPLQQWADGVVAYLTSSAQSLQDAVAYNTDPNMTPDQRVDAAIGEINNAGSTIQSAQDFLKLQKNGLSAYAKHDFDIILDATMQATNASIEIAIYALTHTTPYLTNHAFKSAVDITDFAYNTFLQFTD